MSLSNCSQLRSVIAGISACDIALTSGSSNDNNNNNNSNNSNNNSNSTLTCIYSVGLFPSGSTALRRFKMTKF